MRSAACKRKAVYICGVDDVILARKFLNTLRDGGASEDAEADA